MIVSCKRKVGVKRVRTNLNKLIFCLILFTLSVPGFTQKTIELATRAKQIAETLDFKKGEAYALKNIGVAYYFQGKYLEALDFYQQSLKFFTEIKDYVGMANIYSNMGVVYYDQSDDVKALENYLQSLKY